VESEKILVQISTAPLLAQIVFKEWCSDSENDNESSYLGYDAILIGK
jgi:hypothetical protein